MSGKLSKKLRNSVKRRANGYCEYCQTSAKVVIEMQVDHILPRSLGGVNSSENLCLSCTSCNNAKKGFLTGIDPETQETHRLFNPRTQLWSEHFMWDSTGAILVGLTAVGRATIVRLAINRTAIVEVRRLWVEAGWHPPKSK